MHAKSLIPEVDSSHAYHFPVGRSPGCLPRKSLPGSRFLPAVSRIKTVPRDRWGDFEVSVRPFVKTILNQGKKSSCATEATAQAVMIAREIAGLPFVLLNPLFIYHHTSGGRDQGSSIDDNLAFVREHGCVPEEVWPRSKGFEETPPQYAYDAALDFKDIEVFDIANINEMVGGLLVADPVVYGANGHAVVKVEHLDENKGLDVNSWGPEWGDGGFGVWASYRAVNFAYGAFAVRSARKG